jgi:choline-sulfatase
MSNKVTRREALKIGAGVASGAALGALASGAHVAGVFAQEDGSARQPDLVFILTDQERYETHFPPGFLDEYMPTWKRLAQHGLSFDKAYAAATMCSPSRAAILTGQYGKTNGLPYLEWPSPVLEGADDVPNIATVLGAVGYDVVWKGKWHLSYPVDFDGGRPGSESWSEADADYLEQQYDMAEWNPPEAGNIAEPGPGALATLGGGEADNDGRYVSGVTDADQTPGLGESAVEFLDRVGAIPASERQPFCLFVSLVNPHDIVFYPEGWDDAGYVSEDFADLPIELPPSAIDDLSRKPSAQSAFREAFDDFSPAATAAEKLGYVRFYAYLHGVVDGHIATLLDALDANGLTDDTIVVRTADHGEMGFAHGLREKTYNVYEESFHVPLVISNPKLFPEPMRTDALHSHVDLLPTLAELAGAEPAGVGISNVPLFSEPDASLQDAVLLAFDDNFIVPQDAGTVHIRAVRTDRWTYAVYFAVDGTAFEYELYDNEADPDQMVNLVFDATADTVAQWSSLHGRLASLMLAKNAVPEGFDWPEAPPV